MGVLDGATVRPFGETAVVLEYGDTIDPALHDVVLAADRAVRAADLPGVEEVVPSYRSLLLRLDPLVVAPDDVVEALRGVDVDRRQGPSREVTVEVSFRAQDAPDLDAVAEHAGTDAAGVVRLLTAASLRVYLHGFAPGFAYLGGVPEPLHVPRRATPRPPVPAGSVLLAAGQVALCPTPMPTGWWVVGRTDRVLFDPAADPPVPLAPGDCIRLAAAP